MANSLQKKPFSVAIQGDTYKRLINNTLGNPKKAERFIAAISSAVAANTNLQNCDAGTILSAGLLGEALNLSPSPQLGQYYLVPYGGKAQFQLGYKGYIQLAIRSGQYKRLNVVEIKEGELVSYNPLTEEIKVDLIEDESTREQTPTAGYYAMFEYTNGFIKSIYWSREKMQAHAMKFSKSYNSSTSVWKSDFDSMAKKTLLRQLISKWGIMSIEMQNAVEHDMSVIHEDGTHEYVDNQIEEYSEPQEDVRQNIEQPDMSDVDILG